LFNLALRLNRSWKTILVVFQGGDVADLLERQRAGIAVAKKRGAHRGRKKALAPEQVTALRQRPAAGDQKAALACEFGISLETLYQYLRSAA
jgi:DNA invertase Pin-like site-specific DNA recombinase